MSFSTEYLLADAASLLMHARHLVVFTGAGVSTPSGIPDFRSQVTGLWQKDNPMEVASLTAFEKSPEVFFNWYRPLIAKAYDAKPNPAHAAIAEMEKWGRIKSVVTQNIDGLHQAAGSLQVIELHGSMRAFFCPRCGNNRDSADEMAGRIIQGKIPRCTSCDAILKPGITLFEETLPMRAWNSAREEMKKADLLLIAGTSLEVEPASSLPVQALRNGCRLIIINLTPTFLDRYAKICIHDNVAVILPAILDGINRSTG